MYIHVIFNISSFAVQHKPKPKDSVMKPENIVVCATRLHALQIMNMTFKYEGIEGVGILLRLIKENSHLANISQGIVIGLTAVFESRRWERVNRTVPVYRTGLADPSLLASLIPHLESISCGGHIASELCGGSPRKRDIAIKQIIAGVLTHEFTTEAQGWGLSFFATSRTIDDLEALAFEVSIGDRQVITTLFLDGWSGRIFHEEKWGDLRCSRHKDFQDILRVAYMKTLETMTAPV